MSAIIQESIVPECLKKINKMMGRLPEINQINGGNADIGIFCQFFQFPDSIEWEI